MIATLRKPLAFVVRDFRDETSYKLAFALRFTNIFFDVFVFYFLSLLINDTASPYLQSYGGDYFAFALIGITFTRFFSATIISLRAFIRESQLNGTLEALLSTQTNALTVITSSMLYPFLFTSMEVIVFFALGLTLFEVNIYWSNLPVALIVLVLSLISFTSLGILSAGFIIVYKRGDPVAKILTLTTQILAGEIYPISVLPGWMQMVSMLVPVTYSLEGIRLALLQNHSLSQLSSIISALVIFDIILVPASIIFFNYSIKRAKMDGSLAQY
jgi:ABC-2 type transport system permease protein